MEFRRRSTTIVGLAARWSFPPRLPLAGSRGSVADLAFEVVEDAAADRLDFDGVLRCGPSWLAFGGFPSARGILSLQGVNGE